MAMARSRPGTGPRSLLMLMVPFVAIVAMASVTAGSDGGSDPGIDAARQRWAAEGSADHRITYLLNGFGPATVTFGGGVIVDYDPGHPRLEDAPVFWVDALFEAIDAVADDPAGDVLSVEFDATTGHPRSASLDPDRSRRGEEWTIDVLGVEPLAER